MEKIMIIYRFKFVGYQSKDNPIEYDDEVTRIRNIAANNEHDAWERFKKIAGTYKHYEFKSMKRMQLIHVSCE